jgi:HPt (histidine-containing phosphotransfer) domain-containing protein
MTHPTVFEAPGVVDLAYLESSSFGRADFILQAIDVLLEQLPEQVSDLNHAFSKRDFPLVRLSAHKIKSAASLLGIEPLKEILRQIETADPLDVLCAGQLEMCVHDVTRICAQAVNELKAERYRYA